MLLKLAGRYADIASEIPIQFTYGTMSPLTNVRIQRSTPSKMQQTPSPRVNTSKQGTASFSTQISLPDSTPFGSIRSECLSSTDIEDLQSEFRERQNLSKGHTVVDLTESEPIHPLQKRFEKFEDRFLKR